MKRTLVISGYVGFLKYHTINIKHFNNICIAQYPRVSHVTDAPYPANYVIAVEPFIGSFESRCFTAEWSGCFKSRHISHQDKSLAHIVTVAI
jgi:hypothetical protein